MPLVLIVVVLNDVYILFRAELPSKEKAFAVGQWAPWAAIAMALAASSLNSWYGPTWDKLWEQIEKDRKAYLREIGEGDGDDGDAAAVMTIANTSHDDGPATALLLSSSHPEAEETRDEG